MASHRWLDDEKLFFLLYYMLKKVKSQTEAEELFADLGLNMTSAFTIFVKQAIREQQIPFKISREIPNEETLEAIEEVRQMKKDPSIGKSYTDVDEMMRELLT